MNRFGHDMLKYLLIVPLLMSLMLGILVDGAFKYTITAAHERAALEVKLTVMTLKQLSQQEI